MQVQIYKRTSYSWNPSKYTCENGKYLKSKDKGNL